MERRQRVAKERRCWQKNLLSAGTSALLLTLLAACSVGDMADDTGDVGDIQDDAGDAQDDVPEASTGQFPDDIEGDDRPGMIVTGLSEPGVAQSVSAWLVSVRQFRFASASSSGSSSENSSENSSGSSSVGTLSVELTRYADDFPVTEHIRFFSENLDTCLIRNAQSEATADAGNPPPLIIDGGPTVVFNTASGPQFSIPRTYLSDDQTSYELKDELEGALAEGVTLSIPGAAFPTVPAYPLFEPKPVERLLPELSQSVSVESDFSWIPLDQAAHVKIDFMSHDASGEFMEYPLSCWVEDDGAFELPGTAIAALDSLETTSDTGATVHVRYSRVYSRVDVIDGMVFHQRMEVAESEAVEK